MTEFTIRKARATDATHLAWFEDYCSGGLAMLMWPLLEDRYPGKTPLKTGAARFRRPGNGAPFQSCFAAEIDGGVVGMMFSCDMGAGDPELTGISHPAPAPYGFDGAAGIYHLSSPGVYPERQGHGIGTAFIAHGRESARTLGHERLSLFVLGSNPRAKALYERNGFVAVTRRPVIPHPIISGGGDAILMPAPAR